MMDLLVQVTTRYKIPPGGHVIQVLNERSNDFLYYKPSTPIGKAQSTHFFKVSPVLVVCNIQRVSNMDSMHSGFSIEFFCYLTKHGKSHMKLNMSSA